MFKVDLGVKTLNVRVLKQNKCAKQFTLFFYNKALSNEIVLLPLYFGGVGAVNNQSCNM